MKCNIHILFLLTVFVSFSAAAGPVHDRVCTLVQPDGTSFAARFRGDEYLRIKTDLHGHAIIQDEDGWWCYASYEPDGRKVCSGFRVGKDAPHMVVSRSMDIPYERLSRLAGQRRAAVTEEIPLIRRIRERAGIHTRAGEDGGTVVKHGIVILAQFANLSFKHDKADFERLLTGQGYKENGAAGCAKEYFDAQFGDSVDFEFVVSDIVTLSQDLAYYGGNATDSNGLESDKAPEEMVIEACRLADAEVDFSLYDDDGDGQVDNVFVFFAGGDEAEGAGDDCIWSHAWYIRDGAGKELMLDGKVINRYACTSEMTRYVDTSGKIGQRLAGIGSFCHEYSHTFGLPDMYDTDYDGSGGQSEALWISTSLMDGGNQNNRGAVPPCFNVIEREILGMVEPEVIHRSGVYTLEPVSKGGKCYRIDTEEEDEYFLLECRAEDGWDSYIGGRGLLVYHIDKTPRNAGFSDSYGKDLNADVRWSLYNEVNCRPDHQCADLLEAVPAASNVRNVFFPSSGISSIDEQTFVSWSGEQTGFSLTGIRMDGDAVVFNVIGGDDEVPPEPVGLGFEKFQDAAVVTFESSRIYEGEASVSWGPTGKEQQTLTLKPYDPGKYALVLEGLEPHMSYTVNIAFVLNEVAGKEGTVSFMTSSDNGGYPYIYLKNVKRNPDGTFPLGSRLPLRIYNAVEAKDILWTFNGGWIGVDASGYYKVKKDGELKAVITWEDGSKDVIVKQIKVSE